MTDLQTSDAFPYPLSDRPWLRYAIPVVAMLFIAFVSYSYGFNMAIPAAFIMLSIVCSSMIIILEVFFTPYEVQIQGDGFLCRFRVIRDRFYSWGDIIWLHFEPIWRKEPEAFMQFQKKLSTPMNVSYAAGLAISDAYSKKMGRLPMDIPEYLKKTADAAIETRNADERS